MSRSKQRLARQFDAIKRKIPAIAGFVGVLQSKRAILIRVPMALLLIVGGFVSFLPFLGLWMLPLGLLLLAIDIPALQSPVSAVIIRVRRKMGSWLRPKRKVD